MIFPIEEVRQEFHPNAFNELPKNAEITSCKRLILKIPFSNAGMSKPILDIFYLFLIFKQPQTVLRPAGIDGQHRQPTNLHEHVKTVFRNELVLYILAKLGIEITLGIPMTITIPIAFNAIHNKQTRAEGPQVFDLVYPIQIHFVGRTVIVLYKGNAIGTFYRLFCVFITCLFIVKSWRIVKKNVFWQRIGDTSRRLALPSIANLGRRTAKEAIDQG